MSSPENLGAHERALRSLRDEGEMLRSQGLITTPPPGAPPGQQQQRKGAVSSSSSSSSSSSGGLICFGAAVWALAFFAVLAFIIQGGTIETFSNAAARARGLDRLFVAGGSSGSSGASSSGVDKDNSGDPAVALVIELTHALDVATKELEAADGQVAALHTLLRSQDQKVGGGGGGGGGGGRVLPPQIQARRVTSGKKKNLKSDTSTAAAVAKHTTTTASNAPLFSIDEAFELAPKLLPCRTCVRHGVGLTLKTCIPATCPSPPLLNGGEGVGLPATAQIVSTSLYGDDTRYTGGVVRNAELMSTIMPGWRLRVYVKRDVLPPNAILEELKTLGTEIVELNADDTR